MGDGDRPVPTLPTDPETTTETKKTTDRPAFTTETTETPKETTKTPQVTEKPNTARKREMDYGLPQSHVTVISNVSTGASSLLKENVDPDFYGTLNEGTVTGKPMWSARLSIKPNQLTPQQKQQPMLQQRKTLKPEKPTTTTVKSDWVP